MIGLGLILVGYAVGLVFLCRWANELGDKPPRQQVRRARAEARARRRSARAGGEFVVIDF